MRHANGAYFVRDTFPGSILAAHRQKLTPEAFASLDTTARHNGIDQSGAQSGPPTPAQVQKHLPEMIANLDSTTLDQFQKLPPEAFASLDPITLTILQELRPEAFANLDSTTLDQLQKLPPEASESRGIYKWEKDQQLWVALGPNMNHWDALIRLTPTVFVPEKPSFGPTFLRWDDAQLQESGRRANRPLCLPCRSRP